MESSPDIQGEHSLPALGSSVPEAAPSAPLPAQNDSNVPPIKEEPTERPPVETKSNDFQRTLPGLQVMVAQAADVKPTGRSSLNSLLGTDMPAAAQPSWTNSPAPSTPFTTQPYSNPIGFSPSPYPSSTPFSGFSTPAAGGSFVPNSAGFAQAATPAFSPAPFTPGQLSQPAQLVQASPSAAQTAASFTAVTQPSDAQLRSWATKNGLMSRISYLSPDQQLIQLKRIYKLSLEAHVKKLQEAATKPAYTPQPYTPRPRATPAPKRPQPQIELVPLTEEEIQFLIQDVMKRLVRHKFSWPFQVPVDPEALGIPDYLEIVSKPMDLETVQKKCESKAYGTGQEAVRAWSEDVLQIWENCRIYNAPGSEYVTMANKMDEEFRRYFPKVFNGKPAGKAILPGEKQKDQAFEAEDDEQLESDEDDYTPGARRRTPATRRKSGRLGSRTPRSWQPSTSSSPEPSLSSSDDDGPRRRRKGPVPTAAEFAYIPTEITDLVAEKLLDHRRVGGGARDFSPQPGLEYEFYVKWKSVSYLHVEWVPEEQIRAEGQHGVAKINRYWKKVAEKPGNEEEEAFPEEYTICERVIDKQNVARRNEEPLYKYLVKWAELNYTDCTWETREDIERADGLKELDDYENRLLKRTRQYRPRPPADSWVKLPENPVFKDNNQLRAYQLEGLNWLIYNWYQRRGSILADEMGLGKTVQSMAFFDHLHRREGIGGPFLVIAPLSTLGHWYRELHQWSDMNIVVYQGPRVNRELIRNYEWFYRDLNGQLVKSRDTLKFDVLITTYEMVLCEGDWQELAQIAWKVCVIDEAQRIKNKAGKLLEHMRSFQIEHRVLLTGTPLQNNTTELWTLLNFVEPRQFSSHIEFNVKFGDLQNAKQVEELHSVLRPHLLRRLKEDVEKSIPRKEETIVEVELTALQKQYYRAVLERNRDFLDKGARGTNAANLLNIVMQLRKVCNHPFLINGVEERETKDMNEQEYVHRFIMASGKVALLDKLLPKLKAGGHRVLIFSQMVRVLDLLESFLNSRGWKFERIDGQVRGVDRQKAIDRFTDPNSDRFVFLLCTRAGGVGINLATADTVIIFDSDWNPQNDVQAQARAHRIGQKNEVKVYRLITKKTYERVMFERTSRKLGLDQAVLGNMNSQAPLTEDDAAGASGLNALDKKEIDALLKHGAYQLFNEEDGEQDKFYDDDIDKIMERNTKTITYGEAGETDKKSTFSTAMFQANAGDADIDIDAIDFWEKILPEKKTARKLQERLEDGSLESKEKLRQWWKDLEELSLNVLGVLEVGEIPPDLELLANVLDSVREAYYFSPKQKKQAAEWHETIGNPRRKRKGRVDTEDTKRRKVDPNVPINWNRDERENFINALLQFGLNRNAEVKKYAHLTNKSLDEIGLYAKELILRMYTEAIGGEQEQLKQLFMDAKGDPKLLEDAESVPIDGSLHDHLFYTTLMKEKKSWGRRLRVLSALNAEIQDRGVDRVGPPHLSAKESEEGSKGLPAWWGDQDDKALMIGTYRHGYGNFEAMIRDTSLFFHERVRRLKEESEEATKAAQPEQVLRKRKGPTAPDILGLSETSWPPPHILERRLKALADKLAKKRAVNSRGNEKREKKENMAVRRWINETGVPQKNWWTPREKEDFRLQLLMSGRMNWSRFKLRAKLRSKEETTIDQHFVELMEACAQLAEEELLTRDGKPAPRPYDGPFGEEVTPAQALRLSVRVGLLDDIRQQLLTNPELPARLAGISSQTPGGEAMPGWWKAGEHDLCLLETVAEYGIGGGAEALSDERLAFYSVSVESDKPQPRKNREQFLREFLRDARPLLDRLKYIRHFVLASDPAAAMNNDRLFVRRYQPLSGDELSAMRDKDRDPTDVPVPASSRGGAVREVARNDDGTPAMPFQLKGITFLSLGEIEHENPKYHSSKYIWPLGYRSVKKMQAIGDSSSTEDYFSEIRKGKDGPLFVVSSRKRNGDLIEFSADTPSGAWMKALRAIKNKKEVSISGPESFGFADPTVKRLIQELPNAEKCTAYFASPEEREREKERGKEKEKDKEKEEKKKEEEQQLLNSVAGRRVKKKQFQF